MIQHYSFGRMVVDCREYTSDLILFPDGSVEDSWWREQGHRLSLADLGALVAAAPKVLVAGTGASGLMEPARGVAETLAAKDIVFRAAPTKEAVALYNQLCGKQKVGACFHLTC